MKGNILADTIRKLFAVYLLLCGIFMVGMIWTPPYPSGGATDRSNHIPQKITGVSVSRQGAQDLSYELHIRKTDRDYDCLVFFSNHQEVKVYEGDELIYELKAPNSTFGRTTGSVWNFVSLDQNVSVVKVTVHNIYGDVKEEDNVFYEGNQLDAYHWLLTRSLPDTIVGLFVLGIGLFEILRYRLINRKEGFGKDMHYFGQFVTVLGLWSLNESDFMTLLVQDRVVCSYMAFMMLLMMSFPFILFVKEYMEVVETRIWKILCGLSLTNIVVQTTLHVSGIRQFKEMAPVTHLIVVLSLIYMIQSLIGRIRRRGLDRKNKINILGIAVLGLGVGVTLTAYYFAVFRVGSTAILFMLAYICILIRDMIISSQEHMDENKKMEIYRQMAVIDLLTGLNNRNAYNTWMESSSAREDIGIITFDLNDLKRCNDTYGYSAGDHYIMQASGMILKTFGMIGNCYRIGGDEFCVIMQNLKQDHLEEYFHRFEAMQNHYNQVGPEVPIRIAYGAARFNPQQDRDLQDTRNRADEKMYCMKKQMKKEDAGL